MPPVTTVLCERRPVGYSSPGLPDWKPADADADEDEPANNFLCDNGAAISLAWQFVCFCDPRVTAKCFVWCGTAPRKGRDSKLSVFIMEGLPRVVAYLWTDCIQSSRQAMQAQASSTLRTASRQRCATTMCWVRRCCWRKRTMYGRSSCRRHVRLYFRRFVLKLPSPALADYHEVWRILISESIRRPAEGNLMMTCWLHQEDVSVPHIPARFSTGPNQRGRVACRCRVWRQRR